MGLPKALKPGYFTLRKKWKGLWTENLIKYASFFSRTKGIEFLQQYGIDPEETEDGELSQGVGYLETKKSYFYIF